MPATHTVTIKAAVDAAVTPAAQSKTDLQTALTAANLSDETLDEICNAHGPEGNRLRAVLQNFVILPV